MVISNIVAFLILAVAGCDRSVGVPDGITEVSNTNDAIVSAGEMATGRSVHTAVRLQDGTVLIAGGFTSDRSYLDSVEVFDPSSNKFSAAQRMNVRRSSHSATLLRDGRVLIAGGYNGNYLDSAELYDPRTKRFTVAPKLVTARSGHTAVMLDDGRVLLAGGTGTGWTFLADAEIFDPSINTFSGTGRMTAERESHTATVLKDGRVMIAGGHRGRRQAITIYSSIEIFDPKSGRFSSAGEMTIKRHKHDAVLLNDGQVLVIGGANERDGGGIYSSVEVIDPSNNRATKIGDLLEPRYKLPGTSILLNNGKVFIAGGAGRSELFDPESGKFKIVDGLYGDRLSFATATLLADGRVLIAGGYNDRIEAISGGWIFAHRDMARSSPDRSSR